MKIKNKILIIFISFMTFTILSQSFAFGIFFQDYVINQEKRQIDTAMESVVSYITEREQKYTGNVNDWGHWDDTYNYFETNNSEYIDLNLTESSFYNLDISFIIMINNNNEVIYKRFYSFNDEEFSEFPQDFLNEFDSIINFSRENDTASSVLQVGNGFYFIAATYVTDSMEVAPANGKLIFGRQISSEHINQIENVTGCKIDEIKTVEDASQLQQGRDSVIIDTVYGDDQGALSISLTIRNPYEIYSSIIIGFTMSRDLYLSSINNFNIFILIDTVAGLIVFLIIFIILSKSITKPFEDLFHDVGAIDIAKNTFTKLSEQGNNEFSSLRKSMNALLNKIETSQKELYDSREKLRATLVSVGDGVITVDRNSLVQFMNPVAQRLTGWKLEEAVNMPLETVFHIVNEYTKEPVESPVKAAFETGNIVELTNHTLLISKDGKQMPVEDNAAPIKDTMGNTIGCVLVFRDFSERKEKQRRIEYLSYHDQLTGLYNRTFFEEEIKRLDVKRNIPLSFVYADVNGLKIINDAFGHENGDKLIQKVADVFKKECRADDIIARTGGDEFVILLPKTDAEYVEKIVKRIKEKITQIKINDIFVSVSLGWETKRDVNQLSLEVLKSAENYMYQKKILNRSNNRNGIIKAILTVLFQKCPREEAHSRRVSMFCERIGKAFKLSADDIKELGTAGELHDIGKISVDEAILNNDRDLNEMEWHQIKQHPETGYRLLGATSEFFNIAEYVFAHHERWDGKGYPKGLKGESIHWKARVIAVADAYDAMTCERSYRKSMSNEEAIEEIRRNSGTQFDPEIARVFIEEVLERTM
ncbi:MAG: HD domain-containing phosphohydrolase [Christensenellales bacterium]